MPRPGARRRGPFAATVPRVIAIVRRRRVGLVGAGMPGQRRGPYLPAIDGLRALAIVAVVGYHIDASRVPGGFLGVDLFLVISGYLITTGLLFEWDQTRRIELTAFWQRRAWRLLPAALAMIVVLLGATAIL